MTENPEVSGTLSNRYVLHEKLWQGATTTVYRATHIQLNREVAIKFVGSEKFNETTIVRFQQEARAIARLQHPNILQVYDFDLDNNGHYFMATEYFPNGDLQRQLDRLEKLGERLSIPQAVFIVKAVAMALEYAHNQGIIHRDVKPSNIFLDGPTRVVVGDFGLAKLQAGYNEASSPGMLVGTPAYISPEQATGGTIDPRTDIYAMGVVLFYLVTGKRPYSGGSIAELVAQHLYSPIPDVTKLRSNVPLELKNVIDRSLAKNPQDRYASAEAFLRDIELLDVQLENGDQTLRFEEGMQLPFSLGSESTRSSRRFSIPSSTHPSQSVQIDLKFNLTYWKIAVLVGALSLLIGIGLYAWLGRGDDGDGSKTNPAQVVAPATANEILVLIAPMQDTTTGIDISQRIADWMATTELGGLFQDRLRIEMLTDPIDTVAEAARVGDDSKANILIWGAYDAAGWHVMVDAPQHPDQTIQTLQLTALNNADLQTALDRQVPILADLYVRFLLIPDMAKQADLMGVFYLTFTLKYTDQAAFALADRPLDKNVVQTLQYLINADGFEADGTATSAIDVADEDITLYYLRWAANVMRGDSDLALKDAERMAGLIEDAEFATGLRLIALYLSGQTAPLIAESQNLAFSRASAIVTAYSMSQQARIGNGEFAAAEANIRAYVDWLTAQGVGNAENTFLESNIYLKAIQGDTAGLTALLPDYKDFRDNRFFLAANVFFRQLQPGHIAPVAFAYGGFREATVGKLSDARTTYTFGLLQHPDYFLLNWQQGQLDEGDGNFQKAYDHYQTAVDSAPVPFPIALYDQALVVINNGKDLEDPRPVCDILQDAYDAASSDRGFYDTLLIKITQLRVRQACD